MISNSSPLIILAKISLLKEFLEIFKIIEITKSVYNEIIEKGLENYKQDAIILNAMYKEDKIKIIELDKKYLKIANKIEYEYGLDKGESETIALALQLKREVIMMDELMGRNITKLFSIKPVGTLRILLELYQKKKLNEDQLKMKVAELIGKEFRLNAELLNKFWQLFEKIKRK